MKDAKLTERERQLWHAVKVMSDVLLSRVGNEIEKASGLSGVEFSVLSRLEELGKGKLGQSELAASMHWHKSRLSHLLTRMEKRGLLARSSHGRLVEVAMLKPGKDALAAARPAHVHALRENLTNRLSTAEADTLLNVFEKLFS